MRAGYRRSFAIITSLGILVLGERGGEGKGGVGVGTARARREEQSARISKEGVPRLDGIGTERESKRSRKTAKYRESRALQHGRTFGRFWKCHDGIPVFFSG